MTQTDTYKILLVGDSRVGKTRWIQQLLTGGTDLPTSPTITTNLYKLHYRNQPLEIWDISGNPEFYDAMRHAYYIGADAVILMGDVQRPDTISHLSDWYRDIKRVEKIPYVVAVNNGLAMSRYASDSRCAAISVDEQYNCWSPVEQALTKIGV